MPVGQATHIVTSVSASSLSHYIFQLWAFLCLSPEPEMLLKSELFTGKSELVALIGTLKWGFLAQKWGSYAQLMNYCELLTAQSELPTQRRTSGSGWHFFRKRQSDHLTKAPRAAQKWVLYAPTWNSSELAEQGLDPVRTSGWDKVRSLRTKE